MSLVNVNIRKRLVWVLLLRAASFRFDKLEETATFLLTVPQQRDRRIPQALHYQKARNAVALDYAPHCFLAGSVCFPSQAQPGMSIKKNDCSRVG